MDQTPSAAGVEREPCVSVSEDTSAVRTAGQAVGPTPVWRESVARGPSARTSEGDRPVGVCLATM